MDSPSRHGLIGESWRGVTSRWLESDMAAACHDCSMSRRDGMHNVHCIGPHSCRLLHLHVPYVTVSYQNLNHYFL